MIPRTDLVVRPRTTTDVPPLVEVLAEQQPASRYPFRWPLPFPAEEFVARAGEEAAWVARVDGRVAGQVAVLGVADDELGRAWCAATGLAPADLAVVASFFVGTRHRGRGVGRALLATAVEWVRERGRLPVLDVVQGHAAAVRLYTSAGWRTVGEARPPWLPDEEPPVLLMVLDPGAGER